MEVRSPLTHNTRTQHPSHYLTLVQQNHVRTCFQGLDEEKRVLMAITSVIVNESNIHPAWLERLAVTLPLARCVTHEFHNFIEGFPEGKHFSSFDDVGYTLMIGKSLFQIFVNFLSFLFFSFLVFSLFFFSFLIFLFLLNYYLVR